MIRTSMIQRTAKLLLFGLGLFGMALVSPPVLAQGAPTQLQGIRGGTRSKVPAEFDTTEYPGPPKVYREVYTFGRLVLHDAQQQMVVIEPPNGLDNLMPASTQVRAKFAELKTRNPAAYDTLMAQQEDIRKNGGVQIFYSRAWITEVAVNTQEWVPGRWVFATIRRFGEYPRLKRMWTYASKDQMVKAHTNQRWDVARLIKDNVFLVRTRYNMPEPGTSSEKTDTSGGGSVQLGDNRRPMAGNASPGGKKQHRNQRRQMFVDLNNLDAVKHVNVRDQKGARGAPKKTDDAKK